MVMRKNIIGKNLCQSIRRSLGRYLAIVAIIALGAGMFVGLRMTKFDMVATGQTYMDRQNMFDLRLLNTYGWDAADVAAVSQMADVADAEGVVSLDVIGRKEGGEDAVYRVYAIPEKVNKVYLLGGRMPQRPDECLVDGSHEGKKLLGTTFSISDNNETDTLESLNYREFTVVGYVSTPLYMDMARGNTTIGGGSVASYLYLPRDAFNVDYYSEIAITIPGEYSIYTEKFNDAMADAAERLKPELKPIAQARYAHLRAEAEDAYAEGMAEYEDGLAEYTAGKREAEEKLDTAYQKLITGDRELEANRQALEDGELQLTQGQKMLDDNAVLLAQSTQLLAQTKADTYARLAQANADLLANYKTVNSSLRAVESGLSQIVSGLSLVDSGITQLESGLKQLDLGIGLMDTLIGIMDPSIEAAQAALEQARENGNLDEATIQDLEDRLQELIDKRAEYADKRQSLIEDRETYGAQLADLRTQREQLAAQQAELEATKVTLTDALAEIDQGFLELQNSQIQADDQFAAAEAELEAGQAKMDAAQREIEQKRQELENGRTALAEAETTLSEGWEAYSKAKLDSEKELGDAQQKLHDGLVELQNARNAIDDMEAPTVYALERTTNVGYMAVDSNSDIVAGVSRVFPVFFLLVAALVCITTMTRMVEEERTQIGTMKALGYGDWAIISKYLIYAGSGAVLGCGLGVVCGSIAFPKILWHAYSIILNLTPELELSLNVPLCVGVVAAYTAVTLFVTWYCCRRELREVPAELIRPKPPTSGKKIFLEHLPFWEKIGFLNKVMFRNIFRYRQRLLMMLVGIGGCTALLVTGFGIGDSIKDIVSYQFQEVTTYDMEVYFSEGLSKQSQEDFRRELEGCVDQIGFFHQSNVELDYDHATRDVYLMASRDGLERFFDLHRGDTQLSMPEAGQALLTRGVAEAMGIKAGDTVTLRNSQMQEITVTVAAVFDNNVYNYVIVSMDTLREQLGEEPEYQMAFLSTRPDQDVHAASAKVAGMDKVMNVQVSQDLAEQVGSMLDAMDLVVATVVACAGLLAVIVVYNLTNINITERIREIATIKVLGFHSAESAAYVFKENLLLTVMGSVLGLLGGKLLLNFVMSQIKIDMVWFQSRVSWTSLLLAVLLTMLSACFVDFILYFKLERINMAEALKSVE